MGFKRYQHVERLGATEVEGINDGYVFVFPKIDGTNSSIWFENDEIKCGSRNRELSLENDNQGFMKYVMEHLSHNLIKLFEINPNLVLYGEWLVPHSLKTYNNDAWRNFYVFDVMDLKKYCYVHYNEYKQILEEVDINFIPPICKGNNLSEDTLNGLTAKNTYLIEDGYGVGEGVVIKNYDFVNKYGRVTWAKIVTNDFKDRHKKVMGAYELMEKVSVEKRIVDEFVTSSLVDKVEAKILADNNKEWSSKMNPRLLSTVYYDLIREESWAFIKKHKNPFIDFKGLMKETNLKVQELKPGLF